MCTHMCMCKSGMCVVFVYVYSVHSILVSGVSVACVSCTLAVHVIYE